MGRLDSLTMTSAPANDFVADSIVYAHLNVDATPSDSALIGGYKQAAMTNLDGSGGILGRALITQTWEYKIGAFPLQDCPINIPLPPLQSVSSIQYVDEAGSTQTLATSEYTVLTGERGAVVPSYAKSWPSTRSVPRAVTITFVCGYGDDPADVPGPIRSAALLMIGDLYDAREAQSVGNQVYKNPAVDALLSPYRVYF
ncbi:MAG: hypothetical protein JJ939_12065 [Alphaproteobacteria bacterium]|nr:hypothetical protein [Alphaproteobacteria bacterium]MBO6629148.1 hypothetical protein [Alphaproteobacteria bacterium]